MRRSDSVTSSVKVAGVLLIFSLLIIPAVTAVLSVAGTVKKVVSAGYSELLVVHWVWRFLYEGILPQARRSLPRCLRFCSCAPQWSLLQKSVRLFKNS